MKVDLNYDKFFDKITENHIKNIIIFSSNDIWKKKQNYNKINTEEHLIWEKLYKQNFLLAYTYGSEIYKEGLRIFNQEIPSYSKKIPNLNVISKILKKYTGWKIQPVSGFVDEIIFFKLLSKCYFPSSDIIRLSKKFSNKYKKIKIKNNLHYTPEPDIFHEIFGHAPFLLNKDYCLLLKKIGKLGVEIINQKNMSEKLITHNLKRLQNFVWWTLEFGVILNKKNNTFEFIGAGILSSYDEMKNLINFLKDKTTSKIQPYEIETIIFKQFDYSKLQNKYFYIESFDKLTEDFITNKEKFLYRGY